MQNKLPEHVAIIMDGNGRWANMRNLPRTQGHRVGAKNVDKIAEYAFSKGVKALTLYAFSSENWQRPKTEVNALMKLLKAYFTKFINKAVKNKVRLLVSGDLDRLSVELRELIKKDIELSSKDYVYTLNVCINYGARQEIVHAVKELIKKGEEITEKGISDNLYQSDLKEPDLIIRTGGEIRLSNFLLYQGAYSELYFTGVLWPDFNGEEFDKALADYALRQRRFGKTEEQVEKEQGDLC